VLIECSNRLVYANRAATTLLGAEKSDQLVGATPNCIEPAYHDLIERLLSQAGSASLVERRWRRLDGTLIDVEVAAGSIAWQGRPAIQVLARDITERRAASEALRASEARYSNLARLLPVGVVRTDPYGRCTYANERWCEIAGCTREADRRAMDGVSPRR
jgi:PAS domain S-box-containing protein